MYLGYSRTFETYQWTKSDKNPCPCVDYILALAF